MITPILDPRNDRRLASHHYRPPVLLLYLTGRRHLARASRSPSACRSTRRQPLRHRGAALPSSALHSRCIAPILLLWACCLPVPASSRFWGRPIPARHILRSSPPSLIRPASSPSPCPCSPPRTPPAS